MNVRVDWRTTGEGGKNSGRGRMILRGMESTADATVAAMHHLERARMIKPGGSLGMVMRSLPEVMTDKQAPVAGVAVCCQAWLALTPLVIFLPAAFWMLILLLFFGCACWDKKQAGKREVPKRYVLHPGWVRVSEEGAKRFIDFPTLAELYQVEIEECINAQSIVSVVQEVRGLVHLYPRPAWNYPYGDVELIRPKGRTTSGEELA